MGVGGAMTTDSVERFLLLHGGIEVCDSQSVTLCCVIVRAGGIPYGSVSGGVANFYSGSSRGAVLPFMGGRSFGGSFGGPTGNFLRR